MIVVVVVVMVEDTGQGMRSLLTLPAAEFQRAYCYWSGQRYLNMHEYLEATQQR
jgi:hypothetical protein